MKATLIGSLPPHKGISPYLKHLAAALAAREDIELEVLGFRSLYPRWLYPGGDPSDGTAVPPHLPGVRVRNVLTWWNPVGWILAALTLRGDIVHAQWWSFFLAPVYLTVLALARLRGRRVVLTLHNVSPHESGRWLYQSVFRFAQHFIVHSHRNAEELVTMYPPAAGRVTVVPHGLLTVAVARDLSREEARRELELPPKRPVILAFGNIRPYKGLDVLLHALRRLLNAGQEATLTVVGQPWGDFEPYRRLIDELGLGAHVRTWFEYVPEQQIEVFFAAADVAVFPYTHFDAQSGAATLALSFGLPTVVSDVGGLPDLVDDPRAVVPASDRSALAQAIQSVLADNALRAKLAADARRRAGELDWGNIARRTGELYRVLAGSQNDTLDQPAWEERA